MRKNQMRELIYLVFAGGFIALFGAIFFTLGGAVVELLTTFRKESIKNNNNIQNVIIELELREERLKLIKASQERHKHSGFGE